MTSTRVHNGPTQPNGMGEDPLTHWTRVFTRFLQVMFATWDKGNYKWTPDEKTTDILIMGEATVAQEVVEKRPAIIVSRGPVAFGNVAMDQFKEFDYEQGKRTHTDLISSLMTFNCLSREGLEAQRIAYMAAYATRVFKRTLMHAGIHRVGEELQIGSESPPGSLVPGDPSEIVLVSVSVPFHFQMTWSVEPIDKELLTEISVAVRSDAGFPAPGAVPIREPGLNGRVLTYSKLVSLNSGVKALARTPRPRK